MYGELASRRDDCSFMKNIHALLCVKLVEMHSEFRAILNQ